MNPKHAWIVPTRIRRLVPVFVPILVAIASVLLGGPVARADQSACASRGFVPGAILIDANLADADLRGCDLTGANLVGANLAGARLGAAVMTGANLGGANLSRADPRGANLTDAPFARAVMTGMQVFGAIGWETAGLPTRTATATQTAPSTASATVPGSDACTSQAAGWGHTFGLATGGTAYCWGAGEYGQLGDGSGAVQRTPVAMGLRG